ncbi:MAG: protein kinase, partial [Polyangia bacterium]|nr:protein kinase [Polyangia bacterium]
MAPDQRFMKHLERDLVFAMQAVQMGLLSQEILVEAGLRWSRERSSSIRQLAAEEGGLGPEDVELVDRVVDRMLQLDGGDPTRTLERIGGRQRVFESLGGTDEAARESLAALLGEPVAEAKSPSGEQEERVTVEASGRYTIRGEHGRGGIGRVLVAYDEHVGREIAIKELLPEPDGIAPESPSGRISARFLREARVTGQLEHPSIVPVYELGRRRDGALYYSMRLVRGKTLAETLRRCKSMEERLRLLPHYVDLCHAIAYAHSRGVIHRDIKTGNVMLGEFGETVVLDWGLAKVRGQQDIGVGELEREVLLYRDEEAGRTVDGRAIGTPAYMSPEQADGRIEDIDERSDVWSLGAVLYELLSGRPPFEGVNAFEVIGKVISEPVPSLKLREPRVPPELSSVCEKALERDPARRYSGAGQLAQEVEAYQSGARVTAYEYSSFELLKRFVARNPALSIVAVTLMAVLIAAAGIIFSAYRSAQDARVRAERSLAAKVKAQLQASVASRQLAQAYLATAEREIALKNYMSAKIYAAAALLHHPDNPRSPFHFAGGEKPRSPPADAASPNGEPSSGWERTLLALQGILFTVRANSRVRRIGVLGAKGGGALFTLAWAPRGDRLAVAGARGDIDIWDVSGRTRVASLPSQGALVAALAYSPDGRWLAAAGDDPVVRLWELSRPEPIALLSGHTEAVLSLSFSRDGRFLASSSKDGTIRVWDLATRTTHALLRGHEETVYAVAFASQGGLIASGGADRTIRTWRLPAEPAKEPISPSLTLRAHEGAIFAVAYSPDGALLASASEDQTIRLWEPSEGKLLAVLRGHDRLVRSLSWDPGGKHLVSAGFDQTLRLWGVAERQVVATLGGYGERMDAVAYSPDGRMVASAGREGVVRLWEVRPQAPVLALSGHKDLVEAVAVSPDGLQLASGSYDHSVRIWDLADGREVHSLDGHSKPVLCVAFSPDGKLLASGGRDHGIRLWDARGGKLEAVLEGHSGDVNSLAFSPDGRWLL